MTVNDGSVYELTDGKLRRYKRYLVFIVEWDEDRIIVGGWWLRGNTPARWERFSNLPENIKQLFQLSENQDYLPHLKRFQ